MSAFTLPTDIDAAAASLGRLGELATATEWKRAAIVATFVRTDSKGGRPGNLPDPSGFETPNQFARRGIIGLSSHTTVTIYARAWLDRYDRPAPGQRIDLPDEPWPPTQLGDTRNAVADREAIYAQAEDDGVGRVKAVDIAKNTGAMEAAIKASPRVAEAAVRALRARKPQAAPEPRRFEHASTFRIDVVTAHLRTALGELVAAIGAAAQEPTNEPDVAQRLLAEIRRACDYFQNGGDFTPDDRVFLAEMGVEL